MGHPPLLPLVPFGVLLVVLLLVGFRRIPCPPTCRRCKYDVSHRPAGVTICSECGADLTRRRAILTRRRARFAPRTRWLVALLFLVTIAWPAVAARTFEWKGWYLRTASDRLIAFHTEHRGAPWSQDAFDEWLRRYYAGKLPAVTRDRFFDYLLSWQADTSRIWDPSLDDLLLNALLFHRLSPERASRFINGTFVVQSVRARPLIHAGDPVPIEFTVARRSITRSGYYFTYELDGSFRRPPKPNSSKAAFVDDRGGAHVRGEFTAHDAATGDLRPGPARLHLLFVRSLIDSSTSSPVCTAVTRDSVDVTVLPPDAPLGNPMPNSAVADAVANSVSLMVRREKSGQLFAEISLAPAPVDRAFNIYANPAHPLLVAERVAAANESGGPLDQSGYEELLPIDVPKDQRSVQIQLVGSDSPLRHTIRQKGYWPGTITYTVPIREYGDERAPTTAPTYTVTPATH